MIGVTLTVTGMFGPAGPNGGAAAESAILREFLSDVGVMLVGAIQEVLGQDSLFSLSPGYAAAKPTRLGYRRVPGKSPEQPLIFSAAMYDAATYTRHGDTVEVYIDPSKLANSFNYAEFWESGMGSTSGFGGVHYLEKALALVEHNFPQMLTNIIVARMGL